MFYIGVEKNMLTWMCHYCHYKIESVNQESLSDDTLRQGSHCELKDLFKKQVTCQAGLLRQWDDWSLILLILCKLIMWLQGIWTQQAKLLS